MSSVLGLRANWRQIALLTATNAFVGGMVGMERSILPQLATDEFGITSKTAAISFIATFGIAKAVTNLIAGPASERLSRRSVLIAGWLAGAPVPLLLIWAPSWGWVIGANVLLGINQGLAWSMTVNMKMDLAGPRRRGLVLGLNESAGYVSVGAAAFLTGVIAAGYGLRPEPFYLGIAFAACGLALSTLFVRDTASHVAAEGSATAAPGRPAGAPFATIFADTTWRRPRLFGVVQAGFVNNLNDGLAWGIFPLLFASKGLPLERIAILTALYPLLWGALQSLTGWLSDLTGRAPLIVTGMIVQAAAISATGFAASFGAYAAAVCLLGLGTALVYPALLAAAGDAAQPETRATTLGVYRFWRDGGAVAGALFAGAIADVYGFAQAIQSVALLTAASGLVAAIIFYRGRPARLASTEVAA
jgi:MFS family permease